MENNQAEEILIYWRPGEKVVNSTYSVERFYGSLKHDRIFKVHQLTRQHMERDVCAYIKGRAILSITI